jgi:GAF domain-containing protein
MDQMDERNRNRPGCGLLAMIAGRRRGRAGLTAQVGKTEQPGGLQAELERRVADRTAELVAHTAELEHENLRYRRRVGRLEAAVHIAQAIAAVLDPDELLEQVTELIVDHLGYYHVGAFILDESGRWAVLRATNSQGGRRMMARQHQLRVGEQGIVGYATRTGRPRLAVNVGVDAIHFDNPDLPETRSEIALPLIAHHQILGALDVQSQEENAFDEQDVAILTVVADQVALALDNARLFEASEAALARAEETQRAYLRRGWRRYAASRRGPALFGSNRPPEGEGSPLQAEIRQTLDSGAVSVAQDDQHGTSLVTPIKIRDQVIGALGLGKMELGGAWSRDQVELVETVADQVAQALEMARLFEEAQRRAEREQLISQVGARLRSVDDIDGILRVAVQETRRALGVSHGAIRLGTETHLLPSAGDNGERTE